VGQIKKFDGGIRLKARGEGFEAGVAKGGAAEREAEESVRVGKGGLEGVEGGERRERRDGELR
jgi:hypothetical protein